MSIVEEASYLVLSFRLLFCERLDGIFSNPETNSKASAELVTDHTCPILISRTNMECTLYEESRDYGQQIATMKSHLMIEPAASTPVKWILTNACALSGFLSSRYGCNRTFLCWKVSINDVRISFRNAELSLHLKYTSSIYLVRIAIPPMINPIGSRVRVYVVPHRVTSTTSEPTMGANFQYGFKTIENRLFVIVFTTK